MTTTTTNAITTTINTQFPLWWLCIIASPRPDNHRLSSRDQTTMLQRNSDLGNTKWVNMDFTIINITHHLWLLSRLELNSQDPEEIYFLQLSERTQFWPKLSRAFSIYIYRALRIYSIKLIFEGTAGCFPFGWTNIPFHCVPVPHDTVSIFSYWGVLLKPVAAFLHFCAKYFVAKYF